MMYDSADSGDTQVVTAFFDSHQAAERARGDLVAAGFPADAIRFVPGAEAANVGKPQHESGHGWEVRLTRFGSCLALRARA